MTQPIHPKGDLAHRRAILAGEPMIFHCHHYNAFLQQTLADAPFLDMSPVQIAAAESVVYAQCRARWQESGLTEPSARLADAAAIFAWAGFGHIDFGDCGVEGGEIDLPVSHYAVGFRSRAEDAVEEPVCLFPRGFAAGALAAAFGLAAGSFAVDETRCAACSEEPCRLVARRREASAPMVFESPGVGPLTDHEPLTIPETPVDYDGILGAVSQLPLTGNDEGLIDAFGVLLTRHYANYYNLVSFELYRRAKEAFGAEGAEAAADLLIEAGRVCAFHTFGGIMLSAEWDALIRPTLKRKEHWVHGMVAVVNALGWGRWQVTEVSPAAAEFALHDDYESVGWLARHGETPDPICFLAMGGVEGLMNLVYIAGIESRPELDRAFYESIAQRDGLFSARVLQSRAAGEPITRIRVAR